MEYIGIKDLKNQTTQVLKAVREEGARYVVTYHGRPTALIVPIDEAEVEAKVAEMMRQALTELDEDTELEREIEALRKEIAETWRSPLTAVEAIEEQRR